jgi:adenylate cyclase
VIYLFEDVHPGNLMYCTAVTVSAVVLLLFTNSLCDVTIALREPIGAEHLSDINRMVQPSMALTALLFILVFTFYLKRQFLEREQGLQRERQFVERILHNLLPDQIVGRLKQGESLIADLRPLVAVLFLDIVGFGALSSDLQPGQLVQGLTRVVAQVDEVMKRFPRVQKIKTIGDAVMCASGTLDPEPEVENVAQIVQLALQLRDMKFELAYSDARGRSKRVPIQFRFGVHCGEAVAGVLSTERFVFDVIGDAVNVASRMEAMSSPSRVLVSDQVRRVLRGSGGVGFVDNGVVEVKGKGRMQTWFVEHEQKR